MMPEEIERIPIKNGDRYGEVLVMKSHGQVDLFINFPSRGIEGAVLTDEEATRLVNGLRRATAGIRRDNHIKARASSPETQEGPRS